MSKLFPELDASSAAVSESTATSSHAPAASGIRATGPSDGRQPGAGGCVLASAESVARIARLFRLGNRLMSVKLQQDNEMELVIDMSPLDPMRIGIRPRGAPAWMEARDFAVTHRGKSPHPAIERTMRQFVFSHYHVPLDAICALVVPNAEDADMLCWDDPDSLVYSYGASKAWRMFFEARELYRGVCERFEGDVVEVAHNELECHYNMVNRSSKALSFFNSVSAKRTEDNGEGNPARQLMTDLQDLDVIRGGDGKLDRVLDSIAGLDEKPQMVIIGSTCVPIVTGDDLEASAARASKKLGLPVIVTGNHNNPQEILLGQMISDPALDHVEKRPGSINLLGMPPIEGMDELLHLLDASGIAINAVLLPRLDPAGVRQFGAAELSVRYAWDRSASASKMLADRFRIPMITPPAPFGMEGSRRWLLAIAEALGRRADAERAWEACTAPHAALWSQLSSKAKAYQVGFVLPDECWREMLSAERSMGVPMIDVLAEIGFGVDLFVYSVRPLDDAPAEQGRIRIFRYSTTSELERLLRASGAVAFYSEMYFDRRLTRTGKNSFSLRDFQLGPRGAVATARRLVATCRLPYYRTYASFLGKPFAPTGERS